MFGEPELRELLDRVASGDATVPQALEALRRLPFEDPDYATLDHHRRLRDGLGEVVYCSGKTTAQVAGIVGRLADSGSRVLATRATHEQFEAARRYVPDLQYQEAAQCIWLDRDPDRPRARGTVVVAAGTSDLQVLEEAVLTLSLMDQHAERIVDVGVAGLHRLLGHLKALQSANVIIVIAGMDGALPSVVGGLVGAPVIAVPTSVGYGASFHGVSALLAMLNSCAPGVSVVNIDNGFAAGYLAATINRRIVR
ncbi:MAG: 1-(5-phosphoribosyl)-5-amino-4-imidazole-carboxylate carboxylase [Phycisphaeraceae bacterium]|nr:1-(5-phosphoribosyl)-5-amino-4-imidazole-carboxylate carboxylase [Phycisphaeraceae bacterium]